RYGPAYTMLTRWISMQPESAEPLQWRGWVLQRLNHSEAAMKDYQRALELDPDYVVVRLRIVEMLLEKSNAPEALPHLEWLRKRFPDRADIMARMGQCCLARGELEEARRLLEGAVEQLPNDITLFICLAKLEIQERHPEEAERWARRALQVDATDTEAQH